MILAYFMAHDRQALFKTIKDWPKEIYDVSAVIVALQSELDRAPSSSKIVSTTPDTVILMECLAELLVHFYIYVYTFSNFLYSYIANRQPGKALQFFIRLRKPNVFDLIRDNNLFTDVQDQALLLVEFDQELVAKQREKHRVEGLEVDADDISSSPAITLLVDHTYSIPVNRFF
jgi:hypothetical protein